MKTNNNNFKNMIRNIMNPIDIEKMYREMMIKGVPRGIYCGVEGIDECFRLDRGKLVVVTGIPNMGKSEFVDYMCVQYHKLYGMRTLYFSPENQPLPLHMHCMYRLQPFCLRMKHHRCMPSAPNTNHRSCPSVLPSSQCQP